jgi:glycosyltransferase involved in cell wall biosynthesis
MRNYKVSVCVITYNHERYISKALDGILIQKTDFEVELIISNDASTDKSNEEILKKIEVPNKNITIRYFNQTKNLGIVPNLNFCLKETTGKYIAICEGDDYWTDPKKLQKQADFLEKNTKYSYCAHNSKRLKNGELIANPLKSHTITFNNHIYSNYINTCTLMFKKNVLIDRPNFFLKIAAADWALQLWALKKSDAYFLEDDMAVYRVHQNGAWNKLTAKEMCMRGVKILKQFRKIFNEKEDKHHIEKAIKKRRNDFGY